MISILKESVHLGDNISVLNKNKTCTVYKMQDDTGEGTMTCYQVFPGIYLLYNDFHMQSCISKFQPNMNMIGIDHCREGRIEWEFQNSYMYLKKGDLQINTKEHHALSFGFPLGHYHGITIAIIVEDAEKHLNNLLDGFCVDLRTLRNKIFSLETPYIIRSSDSIQHIFSELYTVPESIKINYYKIKVLELLLFLSSMDMLTNGEKQPYFSKNHVETVKEIMKFITSNVDKHFTLVELSRKFNIPLTSMKLCFKGVYGSSIYAFVRKYRMQTAAIMLRQTDENIPDIAGRVGYDNSSKFAAAFREEINMSPQEYRKIFV